MRTFRTLLIGVATGVLLSVFVKRNKFLRRFVEQLRFARDLRRDIPAIVAGITPDQMAASRAVEAMAHVPAPQFDEVTSEPIAPVRIEDIDVEELGRFATLAGFIDADEWANAKPIARKPELLFSVALLRRPRSQYWESLKRTPSKVITREHQR